MFLYIRSLYPSQLITVPVMTRSPERMCIMVYHDDKPSTVYFKTHPLIDGKIDFHIRIPKSPKGLILEVYNEANGNVPTDDSFRVGEITIDKLRPSVTLAGIMDKNTRQFAKFSDWFAENAGILPVQNYIFKSPDNTFSIHYKDVIRNSKGEELTTPARINAKTKEMEMAKKYYLNFTVPGRKAINWHEFSHMFKNENPADEFEADKNALFIYLSMGNPKVEAFNVFLKTFANTPSDLNKARYLELDKYIRDFENLEKQAA